MTTTTPAQRFAVCAIPLNRVPVVRHLTARAVPARGAGIGVIAQRPTARAEAAWADRLATAPQPSAADLVALDDPHTHLVTTPTDRLVPAELLDDDGFLTRNLGGWAPILFGVFGLPAAPADDPVLAAVHVLAEHGERIACRGADPAQVAARLDAEVGTDAAGVAAAVGHLHALRARLGGRRAEHVGVLARALADGGDLREPVDLAAAQAQAGAGASRSAAQPEAAPVPRLHVLDELMGQLVATECDRRAAVAEGEHDRAAALAEVQAAWAEREGLRLLLKGEYIAGRHRRSTVLLARGLGLVVKQPAPEPDHDIAFGADENWPYAVDGGALVTARGRLAEIVADDLVPQLDRISGREVAFSTLLGLIVEPFVDGPTLQAHVLEDPARMTPEVYDELVVAELLCEALGVDNPDWHAANFIVPAGGGSLVHIDWGAATPLDPAEATDPAAARARLDKVANVAYSFHDTAIAERVGALHADLLADPERLERLRRRAADLAARG
ncbi:MAG: hypothetical protein ACQETV_07420 [Actinomycetota bacterium]